jgi:hypothetical protein
MRSSLTRFTVVPAILVAMVAFFGPATNASAKPPKIESDKGTRSQTTSKRQQVIEQFDANGDGKLDSQEMAAARKAAAERRKNKGARGNSRGNLSDEQAAAGNGLNGLNGLDPTAGQNPRGNGRAKIMERFDLNRDGILSDAEMAQAAQYMQQNGMGGAGAAGRCNPNMLAPGLSGTTAGGPGAVGRAGAGRGPFPPNAFPGGGRPGGPPNGHRKAFRQ